MRHIIQKQMFHSPQQGGMADAVSSIIGEALAAQRMYCAPSWQYGVWMYDASRNDSVFYNIEALSATQFPLQGAEGVDGKKNARSRNCGPFKTKNKKHEAKIINYLEFETICITNAHILIEWTTPQMEENETLRISRAAFEQWLYKTCRLDWCLTELISGEHQTQPTYEWIYALHGISITELKTYIVECRLIG